MPSKPPDYEAIIQQQWQHNAAEVRKDLENNIRNLREKIHNYATKFHVHPDDIRRKIETDILFANCFAKDPTKQTSHEQIAAHYISRLPFVNNFRKLPVNGKEAFYVAEGGEIMAGTARQGHIKTLDFTWQTNDFTCFATHKYTKNSGGAQDNQFADVLGTMHRWSKGNAQPNTVLFAILDGKYFTSEKMREVKQEMRLAKPMSFALPISELEPCLKQLFQFHH